MAEQERNGADKFAYVPNPVETARLLRDTVFDWDAYNGRQVKNYVVLFWQVAVNAARQNRLDEVSEIIAKWLPIKFEEPKPE